MSRKFERTSFAEAIPLTQKLTTEEKNKLLELMFDQPISNKAIRADAHRRAINRLYTPQSVLRVGRWPRGGDVVGFDDMLQPEVAAYLNTRPDRYEYKTMSRWQAYVKKAYKDAKDNGKPRPTIDQISAAYHEKYKDAKYSRKKKSSTAAEPGL